MINIYEPFFFFLVELKTIQVNKSFIYIYIYILIGKTEKKSN